MKGIDMKQCYCCLEIKPIESFSKDRTRSDGLQNKCKTCCKDKKRAWRLKNIDKVSADYKKWQKNNRGVMNAHTVKYQAMKKSATPSWANLEAIKSLYNVAHYFDWISGGFVKHHVDHIVPLQGKTVCGLHVENNLQILIDKDNLRKSNHHG
jgi:hypothetical protein